MEADVPASYEPSCEEAAQTGVEPTQARAPVHTAEVEFREYTPAPPGPTRATGNVLIDFVNQTLDSLLLGDQAEPSVEEPSEAVYPGVTQQRLQRLSQPECEGQIDYPAVFSSLCLFPTIEQRPVFSPLPTATPVGRFADLNFFTREILSHFCEDEPETHLPYLHFHRAKPTHYTYAPAEGSPNVPGWAAGSSASKL